MGKKAFNKNEERKVILLQYALGVVVFFAILYTIISVGQNFSISPSLLSDFEKPKIISEDVFLKLKNEVAQSIELPKNIETDENFEIILDLKKYGDLYGKTININSSYLDFDVYLSDKLIFSYNSNKNSNIKSGASSIHLIDMPKTYSGTVLKIAFKTNLEYLSGYTVGKIQIGKRASILVNYYSSEIYKIIFAINLIGMAIIFIIFNIISKIKGNLDKRIFAITLVCIVCGVFILVDSWFTYYFIRNSELLYVLRYSALTLVVIPFILVVKDSLNPSYRKILNWTIVFNLIIAIINTLLTQQKMVEYVQIRPIIYFILFVSVSIMFTSMGLSSSEEYKEKKKDLISISPIAIAFILSFMITIFKLYIEYTHLIIITLSFFLVIQISCIIKQYFDKYNSILESGFYKKVALVDSLSGVGTRLAYYEKIKWIENNTENFTSMVLASIDINGLKKINDTYGHVAGDRIIAAMGKILKNVSKRYGDNHVFRTGGDEFVVFIFDLPYQRIEDYIFDLRVNADRYTQDNPKLPLKFASGYEIIYSGRTIDIEKAFNQADKKMYEEKAKQKLKIT